MVKRGAVIGIGFFLLGVGLTSLVLMKMEGVYRPASKGQPDLHDVKPPAPSQQEPGTQPGFELRPLPVTPDSIKQTPEPGSQTEQSPAPQSVEEPKNPPLAETKSQPRPSPEALPPVVIRFRFDPAQQREINVAQVHLGDSISVRVRRRGLANLGLHLAFAVPDTLETDAWRQWSTGARRAAVAPIHDTDRIVLTADGDFGVALIKKLDSNEGAVLRLGADYPAGHNLGAPRGGPAGWGGYVIEMRIYPGNRWKIKPRSLM